MSDLDEDFPLGDGVADLDAWVGCPHCGEQIELTVDPGGGPLQEYTEDCEVCCRPMVLTVRWGHDGHVRVEARTESDS